MTSEAVTPVVPTVHVARASVDDYWSAEEDFDDRYSTPGSDFDLASSAAESESEPRQVKNTEQTLDRADKVKRTCELLEFYFSEASMRRDHWLRTKAREQPDLSIDLSFICSFKKMRHVTKDLSIVAEAADLTDVVTLNADRTRIRRTVPLGPDPESLVWRSLVLENLPDGATPESLKLLCEEGGPVECVWILSPSEGEPVPEPLAARLAMVKTSTCAISPALRPTGMTIAIVALEEERDKMTACRTLNGKEDMKVSLLVTSLKEKKRKPPTARHMNVFEADGSGLDSDGGERCLSRSPRSETPPVGYVCRNCNIPGHFLRDCTAKRTEPPPPEYICRKCEQPGHWVQECPNKRVDVSRKPPSGYVCHKCDKPGHWIHDCPENRAKTMSTGQSPGGGHTPRISASQQRLTATPPKGYNCHLCGSPDHYIADCPRSSSPRNSPLGSPAGSPRTQRKGLATTGASQRESSNWRAKSALAKVGFTPRSPSPARRGQLNASDGVAPLGVTRSPLGPTAAATGFGRGRGRVVVNQ